MASNINRNISSDAWLKWPCWDSDGRRCWCTKTTRTCRMKGNYIKDFSGSGTQDSKASETITQAGMGAGLFTMVFILAGVGFVLNKVLNEGKGIN